MAVYDGFFDAEVVGENEDGSPKYDRDYGPGDFTDYFANIIGSGVCIHENPDSFKAEYEDGTLYLRPGYLFIQGYWLANKAGPNEDADTYKGYAVTLPTNITGTLAVVAHLNLGQLMIEIETRSVSQAYPDALVLAIVTASTAEDTRHNTDLCGVIDSAGDLSGKVEDAINFIDNEVEGKLEAAEAEINAQAAKLDAKIAEVQAVADRIAPPPIGSIKFSASQDVDEEWLKCDGSFVSEVDYPELVAALGKLTPSGDKFQVISSGEIGPQISNGVVYGGKLWVYSYSTKKLYGVDLAGTADIKEIAVTSEDADFANFISPGATNPICLSIVQHKVGTGAKIFLSQVVMMGGSPEICASGWEDYFCIFCAEFSGSQNELALEKPFTSIQATGSSSDNMSSQRFYRFNPNVAVPYVISVTTDGKEVYHCIAGESWGYSGYTDGSIYWESGAPKANRTDATTMSSLSPAHQRVAYNTKNKEEAIDLTKGNVYSITSRVHGVFNYTSSGNPGAVTDISNYGPITIGGETGVIAAFSKTGITVASTVSSRMETIKTLPSLPSASRVFVDGAAYLWGKDIYLIFVGTGIIFSRTLEDNSFGYLDTTSVLGTITQFGYLDYSQDEGTLYLLGQDTTNTVKVAKIVLNTLYDYANDGAWLPMIASDGVPAYIKAKGDEGGDVITDPVTVTVTVSKAVSNFDSIATVLFNGDELIGGTYTRTVSQSGMFTVGLRIKNTSNTTLTVKLNGTNVISVYTYNLGVGYEKTESFKVSDFLTSGITLQGTET